MRDIKAKMVVNTVQDLREALHKIGLACVEPDNLIVRESEINLIDRAGDLGLTLSLVEETLSDGSKVYDVEVS